MSLIISDIGKASEFLDREGLIGIPTETVYGLAGYIRSNKAIKITFELKNRLLLNPLIVHIKSLNSYDKVTVDVPDAALRLAKVFSPRPVTLVLNKYCSVEDIETVIGKVKIVTKNKSAPDVPGILSNHYFPVAPISLTNDIQKLIKTFSDRKIGLLLFDRGISDEEIIPQEVLSASGDSKVAAANLYAALHHLDKNDLDIIIVGRFPDTGLGRSINDRLERVSERYDMYTIIRNATTVNEGNIFIADVFISDARIESIPPLMQLTINERCSEIDSEYLYLIPRFKDDQVYFRVPRLTHKGTICTESKVAVAGGITSFMDISNTIPNTLTQELPEEKYMITSNESFANYSLFMGGSKNNSKETLTTYKENVNGISDNGLYFNSEERILANYPGFLEQILCTN